MRAFRNTGAHAVAMRKLLEWCDEASYAHLTADDGVLPPPDAAYPLLLDGKTSKVNHPSAQHAAGRTVSGSVPVFGIRLRPK